jgi:uncharacterized membrane protein YjfL (UPF0719 family)
MALVGAYGLTVLWLIAFLALAFVASRLFDRLTPFELGRASRERNAAVGHVMRGLYMSLALILIAAIRTNHHLGWALLDGAVGIVLILIVYFVFDRLDPRDFGQELDAGNVMLGMELEGLFILAAAIIVGAMNLAVV